MQLQKLVYLCHGWVLGGTGEALIMDRIEAWDYGPVIPNLYHHYKKYKGNAIKEEGMDHSNRIKEGITSFLIDEVLKKYGNNDGISLSSITHEEGSPWDMTIRKHGLGAVIQNDVMEKYYTRVLLKHLEEIDA